MNIDDMTSCAIPIAYRLYKYVVDGVVDVAENNFEVVDVQDEYFLVEFRKK